MNMNRSLRRCVCIAATFAFRTASCFEVETHAFITKAAFERSSLRGSDRLLQDLGIHRLAVSSPFNTYWDNNERLPAYFDYSPGGDGIDVLPELGFLRYPTSVEECHMERLARAGHLGSDDIDGYPIQNWIIRGSIREDDLGHVFNLRLEGCGGNPDIARFAGDLQPRVFNHFYDPIYDTGLLGVMSKSVDWALGYESSFEVPLTLDANRNNHFSYVDARRAMWQALTGQPSRVALSGLPYGDTYRGIDARARARNWSTVFRSLGDVIHLLQDGAQPQHVRNDAHSPGVSAERQSFEGYTNARVLKGQEPEEFINSYVYGFFAAGDVISLAPVPAGSYPIPRFATPLRFFTSRSPSDSVETSPMDRLGLMDYTNRGFFTGGTLPGGGGGDGYAYPKTNVDPDNGYIKVEAPCRLSAHIAGRFNIGCVHWTHEVKDSVQPTYVDILPVPPLGEFAQPPLITESVLGKVGDAFGTVLIPKYALGIEELDATANLTIPRAIGYSAGMLDFFFRGRLEIGNPPGGLFAVLDHGTEHAMVEGVPVLIDGSNRTFGYELVRLRARNVTPAINEPAGSGASRIVPQDMRATGAAAAKVVAVARYHRNVCYRQDLSGELVRMPNGDVVVPAGCSPSESRSETVEISVSAPLGIDEEGNLPGTSSGMNMCANHGNINSGLGVDNEIDPSCANESALLEFDFSSDPIPANATDLFLQVAYLGPLGEEQDGIAVGSMDIGEPDYYAMWNNTDWIYYFNAWSPPYDVPPSGYMAPSPSVVADLCFGDQRIARLRGGQMLPAGREFIRIGVLADLDPHGFGSRQSVENGFAASYRSEALLGNVRQAETEEGLNYIVQPMSFVRGINVGIGGSFVYFYTGGQDASGDYLNLPPLVPSPRGVGLASKGAMTFTSTPGSPCDTF